MGHKEVWVGRRQAGDTIIEVLIALSVIGLTLAAAFGLANGAVSTGRAAQERTEALKIAESQLELLKVHYKADPAGYDALSPSSTFCIDDTIAPGTAGAAHASNCADIDGSGGSGVYTIEITPNVSAGTYQILVNWILPDSGSTEPGTVDLFYRVGVL